ncbi:unnamed protein product [Lasius platythorax]|uniref:Uncharacterized protein n=1 Tax=Lasius platythorax TaxID=488582 RepID=A0AAV2NEH8_9HYME
MTCAGTVVGSWRTAYSSQLSPDATSLDAAAFPSLSVEGTRPLKHAQVTRYIANSDSRTIHYKNSAGTQRSLSYVISSKKIRVFVREARS